MYKLKFSQTLELPIGPNLIEIYVDELNTKHIAAQSAIKYSGGYRLFGSVINQEKYRKLTEACLAKSAF